MKEITGVDADAVDWQFDAAWKATLTVAVSCDPAPGVDAWPTGVTLKSGYTLEHARLVARAVYLANVHPKASR